MNLSRFKLDKYTPAIHARHWTIAYTDPGAVGTGERSVRVTHEIDPMKSLHRLLVLWPWGAYKTDWLPITTELHQHPYRLMLASHHSFRLRGPTNGSPMHFAAAEKCKEEHRARRKS